MVWEISRVGRAAEALPFLLCCALTAAAPWAALAWRWQAGAALAAAGVLSTAVLVRATGLLAVGADLVNLPVVQLAGVLATLVVTLRDAGRLAAGAAATGLVLCTAAAAVVVHRAAQFPTPPASTVAGIACLLFGGAFALGVFLRPGYSAASRWTTGSTSAARMDLR